MSDLPYHTGQVDCVVDSALKGLGFDSQQWSGVKVLGKLHIPHCLSLPSCTYKSMYVYTSYRYVWSQVTV